MYTSMWYDELTIGQQHAMSVPNDSPGLRENIRALGEYAVTSGQDNDAARLMNSFFATLDAYDRVLYDSIQNPSVGLDMKLASSKLEACIEALDALLGTVPPDLMAKSRAMMLATTRTKQISEGPSEAIVSPEEDKLLTSLLK